MKSIKIQWNQAKDAELRTNPSRGGIGLAECAAAIENGQILDDIPNEKRPNQRLMIIEINAYAYVVPYVNDGGVMFLKTMFPSRNHTARYVRTKS